MGYVPPPFPKTDADHCWLNAEFKVYNQSTRGLDYRISDYGWPSTEKGWFRKIWRLFFSEHEPVQTKDFSDREAPLGVWRNE
jgi:hypothetical protein